MAFLSIKNLTKIYHSKNGEDVHALKDINLSFPTKGLVFIVGKSGSGKSTLLNIVGGLDEATSGDVVYQDRPYSEYSHHDFNLLRKYGVGFIFQDFSLVDHLTVYDNLNLALTIRDEELSRDEASAVLREVGLRGYEDRRATELSAGQKQRVAIARAIVKKPKILLCDEPTGNLDFTTSQEVLHFLKNISQNSLVIIVSHNLEDAYFHADRIIELSEGRVTSDLEIDPALSAESKTVYFSSLDFLDEAKIDDINGKLKTGEICEIKSRKSLFRPHVEQEDVPYQKEVTDNAISFSKSFRLTNKLLRKQFKNIVLLSFAVSLMLSIFGVSYLFSTYDSHSTFAQLLNDQPVSNHIYRKGADPKSTNLRYINPIEEKDIKEYRAIGVEDKAQYVVNYPCETSTSYGKEKGIHDTYNQKTAADLGTIFDPYLTVRTHGGILVTNEDYVKRHCGIKGEFEYLAKADEFKDYGIFITDYCADNYIKYTAKSGLKTYEDLVGYDVAVTADRKYHFNQRYVNGIIKTDYRERFKTQLETIASLSTNTKELNKYKTTGECVDYLRNAYMYYDFGFSFNPNFKKDLVASDAIGLARTTRCSYTIELDDAETVIHHYSNTSFSGTATTEKVGYYSDFVTEMPKKTFGYPYKVLNDLFSLSLTAEQWRERIKPDAKVKVSMFDVSGEKVVKERTYDFQVIDWTYGVVASPDVVRDLLGDSLCYSDVYFDVQEGRDLFADLLQRGYTNVDVSRAFVDRIVETANTYSDLFVIILVFALVAATLFLGFVSYHSVRRFSYEIGVIKSLGGSTKDVFRIFVVQQTYLYLISVVLAMGFFNLLTYLANTVLLAAFNRNSGFKYTIRILVVDYRAVLIILGVITLTCIVALILPFIQIKRLKPINILKAKY